jgi:hypothetical protein
VTEDGEVRPRSMPPWVRAFCAVAEPAQLPGAGKYEDIGLTLRSVALRSPLRSEEVGRFAIEAFAAGK